MRSTIRLRQTVIRLMFFWFLAVFFVVILSPRYKLKKTATYTPEKTKPEWDIEIFENRLVRMQLFPVAEQRQMIKIVFGKQPELKEFLLERFNLTRNGRNVGGRMANPLGTKVEIAGQNVANIPNRRTEYVLNTEDNCTYQSPFVLILVHSRWSNVDRRYFIRNSWASIKSYNNYTIKTVFLLGLPSDGLNGEKQKVIILENRECGDIVQGEFVDEYRNLTIKHLMAYQWTLSHCRHVTFVVKVDDDTIVNVFRLIEFLTSGDNILSPKNNVIYCSACVNHGPCRDERDKWFVSKSEYSQDKYPTYCEGFAYITTLDGMARIHNASLVTPVFWIDDVFVTGVLAKAAGVRHKQFQRFYGYTIIGRRLPEHLIKKNLFFLQKHFINDTVMVEMWKKIFDQYKLKT